MSWKSLIRYFRPHRPIVLPSNFLPGTSFALYMRLPLTRDETGCKAWDVQGGRGFDARLFETRALPCSQEEFLQAIAHLQLSGRRVLNRDVEWLPVDPPDRFPEEAKFVDDEGAPEEWHEYHLVSWVCPGGAWDLGFSRNAFSVDEREFRAIVARRNQSDYEEQQPRSEKEGLLFPFQFIYRCDQLRAGREYASDIPRDIYQYLVPFFEAAHCLGSPVALSEAVSNWLENPYLKAWIGIRRELFVPALRWALDHPERDYRVFLPESLKAPCSSEQCMELLALCLRAIGDQALAGVEREVEA